MKNTSWCCAGSLLVWFPYLPAISEPAMRVRGAGASESFPQHNQWSEPLPRSSVPPGRIEPQLPGSAAAVSESPVAARSGSLEPSGHPRDLLSRPSILKEKRHRQNPHREAPEVCLGLGAAALGCVPRHTDKMRANRASGRIGKTHASMQGIPLELHHPQYSGHHSFAVQIGTRDFDGDDKAA